MSPHLIIPVGHFLALLIGAIENPESDQLSEVIRTTKSYLDPNDTTVEFLEDVYDVVKQAVSEDVG